MSKWTQEDSDTLFDLKVPDYSKHTPTLRVYPPAKKAVEHIEYQAAEIKALRARVAELEAGMRQIADQWEQWEDQTLLPTAAEICVAIQEGDL